MLLQAWQLHISMPKVSTRRLGWIPMWDGQILGMHCTTWYFKIFQVKFHHLPEHINTHLPSSICARNAKSLGSTALPSGRGLSGWPQRCRTCVDFVPGQCFQSWPPMLTMARQPVSGCGENPTKIPWFYQVLQVYWVNKTVLVGKSMVLEKKWWY